MKRSTVYYLSFGILLGFLLYVSALFLVGYHLGYGFPDGQFHPRAYLPLLLSLLFLGVLHWMVMRRSPDIFVNLKSIGVVALSVLPGVLFAVLVMGAVGSFCFNWAWEKAVKEGYALEEPPPGNADTSDDNAVVWLNRSRDDLNKSVDKGDKDESMKLSKVLAKANEGSVTKADMAYVRVIIKGHRQGMDLLRRSARCKVVNWEPCDYGGIGEQPLFAHLLKGSKLLVCSAVLAKSEGRFSDAAQDLKVAAFLADATSRTDFLIGEMVGIAEYNIYCNGVQCCLADKPRQNPDTTWITGTVDPDRIVKGLYQSLSMEYMLWRKSLTTNALKSYKSRPAKILSWFIRPYLYLDTFTGIWEGRKVMASFKNPYPVFEQDYQAAERDYQNNAWVISVIALPKFDKMFVKALACSTRLKTMRLACTARIYRGKYGAWPAQVDDLGKAGLKPDDWADPFTLGKIRMIHDGGYLVFYSPGPDLQDEQGRTPFEIKQMKGDLAFRVPLVVIGK